MSNMNPTQDAEMRAVPMDASLRERYLTDAAFHAKVYVAGEAMHRVSGFDPDWTGWPCGACLSRACVALDAVERAAASTTSRTT